MPTVVDSLVTTIGLDTSAFKLGSREVEASIRRLKIEGDRFAKEFEASGKTAAQFFAQAKTEALGLIGTLVGAGGMAAFVKQTTQSLADLGRTALNIGVSIPQLNAFQNVIERNGGTAESATASMKGLVDQIERFKVFGDPTVFKFLNPIGASIDDTPLGIWQKFVEFADKHQNDPALVNLIGKGLGFDQGLINASMQIHGATNAVQQLHEEMQRVATPEMVKNAIELQKSWEDLAHQATFTGYAVMNNLSPALQSVLKWGKDELEQNPGVITALTAIVGALTTLGAIRISASLMGLTGLAAVTKGLVAIVERLALSWGTLALSLHGDTPPPEQDKEVGPGGEFFGAHGAVHNWWQRNAPQWLGGGTGGASLERQAQVRDQLARDLGITPDAASGIVSNLNAESGLQGINERTPRVPGSRGGFGWAQWTGQRRLDFEAYAKTHGLDPASDAANYGFLIHELQTKYPGLLAQLKRGNITASEAANLVFTQYESGGDPSLEGSRAGHVAGADRLARLRTPSAPGTESRIDPALVPQPGASVSNSTNTNSTSVSVGDVHVHTQATDAHGIAGDLHSAVTDAFVQQANRGLQ